MKYLAILGQNPELSLAELVAVYPDIKIISRQNEAVIFYSEEKIDINILGGLPKLAEVLEIGASLKDIRKIITDELLKLGNDQKIFFGLSFYNSENRGLYNSLGKEIKKALKDAGYRARWAVSRELALSSVYIKTNKLLTRGFDFDIVFLPHPSSPSTRGRREEGVCVAKTTAVQDFADYEFRDMGRPRRDLVSGMTPPKLAKMLINLANLSPSLEGEIKEGAHPTSILPSKEGRRSKKETFLDPFCGSGTLLMEAALLGYKKICGSDVSGRAVNDSAKNLNWLKEKYNLQTETNVKQCDVTNLKKCWPASRTDGTKPPLRSGSVAPETSAGRPEKFSAIATEPYLGPPVRGTLSPAQAQKLQKEMSGLYEIYLKNLSSVLNEKGTLVLIVPFFLSSEKIFKTNLDLKKAGLSAVRPSIKYSRPDQKIGREIYILKKI